MEPNVYTAGQENFNLPHDLLKLPTEGKFYKTKKKSVKIGYLTANDENILISGLNNSQQLILNLLRSKIYEHDIRPENLIDSDVEAILIFLRNTSFGPEYKFDVIDTKTGKKFETTILLDELEFKKVENLPSEDGTFTVKLPKSQSTVKIRPLTFGENLEIDKMVESYPTGRVAPKITWRLQKQIVDVEGNSELGFISKFISELPIMDSKFIRNFLLENVPSLDLRKKVKTPSGDMVDIDVNLGVEFFRPFF